MDVSKLTVALLKNELEQRSLSSKGLKAELVARLQEALAAEAAAPDAAPLSAAEPAAAPDASVPPPEAEQAAASAEPPCEEQMEEPPAPVAVPPAAPAPAAVDVAQPAPVAEPSPMREEEAPAAAAAEPSVVHEEAAAEQPSAHEPAAAKRARSEEAEPMEETAKASRPEESALLVEGLVRPFTLPSLRELLRSAGGEFEDASDFWISGIRDRAVVVYASHAQAQATLAALDGLEWPAGNRKVLRVRSLPELTARRAMVEGSLPFPAAAPARPPPPAAKPAAAPVEPKPASAAARLLDARAGPPPPGVARGRGGTSLDELFHKTLATPCLYWLPLTAEEVRAKVAKAARR